MNCSVFANFWNKQRVRRLLLVFITLIVLPGPAALGQSSLTSLPELTLESEAAILIEAETGTVLFAKNEEDQHYPASIAKLVTAIVALESSRLDEIVTVSKEARYEIGTRIYLSEGEQKPMLDLIYGLMLNSGNDAATAIAEHIDGTKEQFAERMNVFMRDKANAQRTVFTNPSGLPDSNMVTTAKDMAAIARYAMRNQLFREIVSTISMPWIGQEWVSELRNHNRLLGSYEGVTGIKNGYTRAARFTLVASAERDGMELIGVILKAPSSQLQYGEMRKLLDYGFEHFEKTEVIQAGDRHTVQSINRESSVIYEAREPVIGVQQKGQPPVMVVNRYGEVWLQTGAGITMAGELELVTSEQPMGAEELGQQQEHAEDALLEGEPGNAQSEPNWIGAGWSGGMALLLLLGGTLYVLRRRPGNRAEKDVLP